MASPKNPQANQRSLDQLRKHYEIEKELAAQLRNSTKQERRNQHLYLRVYDELFKRVLHHPQLTENVDPAAQKRQILRQIKQLAPFMDPQGDFLELGPGDCRLSFEACRYMRKVYGIDVSKEITKNLSAPPNFELRFSDGASIPLPAGSIHLAYSHQLMEHCHPDDAVDQLQNLYACLKPGGRYLCVTPHRFSGPHDISRNFTEEATGFHLKEYTNLELYRLFKATGFARVEVLLGFKGTYRKIPVHLILGIERLLGWLPFRWRRALARRYPFKPLLGIRLLATKSGR